MFLKHHPHTKWQKDNNIRPDEIRALHHTNHIYRTKGHMIFFVSRFCMELCVRCYVWMLGLTKRNGQNGRLFFHHLFASTFEKKKSSWVVNLFLHAENRPKMRDTIISLIESLNVKSEESKNKVTEVIFCFLLVVVVVVWTRLFFGFTEH